MWSGKGKLPLGSKEKPSECGLEGKIAARVKGKAIGVWSGKEKLPPGSKRKPSEGGLARKKRRLGQRGSHRSVVWQGKNAARVKGKAEGVWSGKQNRRLGQRNSAPKSN